MTSSTLTKSIWLLLPLLVSAACSGPLSPPTAATQSALTTLTSELDPLPPGATGFGSAEALGTALTTCDLDGDGVLDVIVGAPLSTVGGTDAGRIEVHSGLAWPGGVSDVRVGPAGSQFGSALHCAPDVNADGFDDLLVGAPNANAPSGFPGVGAAMLFLGGPTGLQASPQWTSYGASFGGQYGASLASGDLTGDGLVDLAVGAPQAPAPGQLLAGAVAVFSGTGSGFGQAPDWTMTGTSTGDRFGAAIAVGDLGGPPGNDLLVSAPLSDAGAVDAGTLTGWAFGAAGPSAWWTLDGAMLGGELGTSLRIHDLSGDGVVQVIAGEPGAVNDAGRVFVWGTPLTAASPFWATTLGLVGDRCGDALSPIDLDRDGGLELAVGCPGAGVHGGVRLFWPTLSYWTTPIATVSGGPTAPVGTVLAGLPAQNGAPPELLLGAPAAVGLGGGAGAGLVERVGLAFSMPRPDRFFSGISSTTAGHLIAGSDWDEDGYQDVLLVSETAGARFPGPSVGTQPSGAFIGRSVSAPVLADVNADGFLDAVGTGAGLTITLGGGSPGGGPTVSVGSPYGSAASAERAAVGNMDDDPALEIVVATTSGLYLWDPADPADLAGATVTQLTVFSGAEQSVLCVDANGDGYDDLVSHSPSSAYVRFGGPTGPSVWPDTTLALTSSLWSVQYPPRFVIADPNGDGQDDILLMRTLQGGITEVLTLDLANGWILGLAEVPDNAEGVAAGDLDGDGFDDLVLVTAGPQPGLAILHGSPDGLPMEPTLGFGHLLPAWWTGLGIGDVDDDGVSELLIANASLSHVAAFQFPQAIAPRAPSSAIRDVLSIVEGGATSTLDSGATSVLDNDRGDGLTAVLADEPSYGTVILNADGTFAYTHDGSESAQDAFVYTLLSDGDVVDHQTVLVQVFLVNEAPVFGPSTVVLEGEARVLDFAPLNDPEGDALVIEPDCDGDGQFDPAGTACVFPDDGVYTVSARVTDAGGLVAYGSQDVIAANVDPVIDSRPSPAPLLPGQSWSWNPTVIDPGADTHSFAVSTVPASAPVGVHATLGTVTLTLPQAFAGPGIIANLRVADDDGGTGQMLFVIPTDRDDDGDGLGDRWEEEFGLDPTRDDAGEDGDGDGLSNAEEYAQQTDPQQFDGPTAPRLEVIPADVFTEFTSVPLSLTWSRADDPQDDPLTYRLQIIEGQDSSALLWDVAGLTGNSSLLSQPMPIPIERGQTYSWRVRASDPRVAGPWTGWGSFAVLLEDQRGTRPQQVWPADAVTTREDVPLLFMLPAQDQELTQVEVEIDREGSGPTVLLVLETSGDDVREVLCPLSFDRREEVNWRVRTYQPGERGRWSHWSQFTAADRVADGEPVTLDWPEEGATVPAGAVVLEVDQRPGAQLVADFFALGSDGGLESIDRDSAWIREDSAPGLLQTSIAPHTEVLLVVWPNAPGGAVARPTLVRFSTGAPGVGCSAAGTDPSGKPSVMWMLLLALAAIPRLRRHRGSTHPQSRARAR